MAKSCVWATCLLVLSFAAARAPAGAAIISGPILNPANGHTYYLLSANTWTASQEEAQSLGGNLATINDAVEQNWVYSTFSTFAGINRHLWIGLYDPDSVNSSLNQAVRRTEYVWVSGEPVTYTNWSQFEPNNPTLTDAQKLAERFVHIWYPLDDQAVSRWNDYIDNSTLFGAPLNGVVEVTNLVPEPASLITWLSLAVCGLAVRRVRRRRNR